MKRACVIILAISILMLCGSKAWSAIIFSNDWRSISGSVYKHVLGTSIAESDDFSHAPAVDFTTFSETDFIGIAETYAGAYQTSIIRPTILASIGGASANVLSDSTFEAAASANSRYSVDFNLDSIYTAFLSGTLLESGDDSGSSINLYDLSGGTVLFTAATSIPDTPLSLLHDFTLFAGDYRLVVQSMVDFHLLANISKNGVASHDFYLRLSPIPEPSSLLLLGTGLLSVAGIARRRKS